MDECAFCPAPANSREHIYSDWMNAVFPGAKVNRRLKEDGKSMALWSTSGLDQSARVVCENCNKGFMSDIENNHAKPAMLALMRGASHIGVSKARARSIAIFAFKTAVVLEHMSNRKLFPSRFFPRSLRHRFRTSLEIPTNVRMWLTKYRPGKGGAFFTAYSAHPDPGIEMYVCNYRIGALVLQVVAEHKPMSVTIFPNSGLDHLAVQFFPSLPTGGLNWPPRFVIDTPNTFRRFGVQWNNISLVRG